GVNDVLVESNFVQGCLVKSAACNGGTSIDLRYTKMTGITVRNNTFLDGAARITTPGAVFDRNIVDYLSDCGAVMTNTVVARWNLGLCKTPKAIGANGNRVGTVQIVDREANDLRLVNADDAAITPAGTSTPATTDRFGTPMPATVAGANTPSISAIATAVAARAAKAAAAQGTSTGSTEAATPSAPAAAAPAKDTVKPTVAITSPTTKSTVTGTVTATVAASDNVGVTKVQMLVNKQALGNASLKNGVWSFTVNTASLPKGTYSVVARASDAAGNTADSTAVSVTVR
ncbi:Ig-like domain-containing protein, partial [Nakamurella alba]|uniref:Ig-like domain-containing protein n=1 Tax=Nakamurella alba TaxID=2665158 RepID=UPI001E2B130B